MWEAWISIPGKKGTWPSVVTFRSFLQPVALFSACHAPVVTWTTENHITVLLLPWPTSFELNPVMSMLPSPVKFQSRTERKMWFRTRINYDFIRKRNISILIRLREDLIDELDPLWNKKAICNLFGLWNYLPACSYKKTLPGVLMKPLQIILIAK